MRPQSLAHGPRPAQADQARRDAESRKRARFRGWRDRSWPLQILTFWRTEGQCALRIFDIEQALHHMRQIGGFGQSAEAIVQLAVESVELIVDGAILGDRLIGLRS